MTPQNNVIKLNEVSSLLVLILLSPMLLIMGILYLLKNNFMKQAIKTLTPICLIVFVCFFAGVKYGASQIDIISVTLVAVICYFLGIWVAKN